MERRQDVAFPVAHGLSPRDMRVASGVRFNVSLKDDKRKRRQKAKNAAPSMKPLKQILILRRAAAGISGHRSLERLL
ncbi:MAG: hypothetical protein MPL62_04810 [Alphaproteobacteria bacterium]|nr:hypothetical protein [Alphaproteobacteria bacterium]